jgi:mRNA export factor
MSFMSRTSAPAPANSSLGDLSKDIPLSAPPDDSISDISWSPASNHLAVASWDAKVRIYEINESGGSEGKAMFEGEGPILSCDWSKVRVVSSRFMFYTSSFTISLFVPKEII